LSEVVYDKDNILNNLEDIMASTFAMEQDFKQMKQTVDEVLEFLPNALWVIKDDNFFLLNSQAKKLSALYCMIDQENSDYEIEYKDKIYLIKINKTENSTIISAIDITKQKRDERLASMGKISAHLAHEIRNPIGSISILASTLLNKVDTKNKIIVLEIKKAIYRVERIIKSTLLFTKGVKTDKKYFSLLDLKEEIENSFDFYSISKDISLTIDFKDEMIFGDFELLSIVFQNFLYNALDAIEEDDSEFGEVIISYKKDKNYNIFTIKDSGVPIKDKSILYEPFKTTKLKGHGLGLALSLEIIKAHDGEVNILNSEKGFEILLKN